MNEHRRMHRLTPALLTTNLSRETNKNSYSIVAFCLIYTDVGDIVAEVIQTSTHNRKNSLTVTNVARIKGRERTQS